MSKRNELKAALWHERVDWSLDPARPRCDVCGNPLPADGACDMHEVIVPKRTVMGWPKKQRALINHRYNCILVHAGGGTGCHLRAHACPDMMVAQLIMRHGWKALDKWVKDLPFKVPFSWHRGILSESEAQERIATP